MKNKSLIVWLVLGFLGTPMIISKGYAQNISNDTAVRIIVSEAADQGLKGMICVGEVLRRRGNTKGFYGYVWNRRKHQSRSVLDTAAKAWKLSAHTDYTNGADHFENTHRFGSPWWAKHCVETYQYKDHVFFKELRPN